MPLRPHNNPYPDFPDGGAEVQGGQGTCLRLHSKYVAEQDLEPGSEPGLCCCLCGGGHPPGERAPQVAVSRGAGPVCVQAPHDRGDQRVSPAGLQVKALRDPLPRLDASSRQTEPPQCRPVRGSSAWGR